MSSNTEGRITRGETETHDPYVSVCPVCENNDIGIANGRAGTYHCPNCDIVIGWSRVIRVRRSRYKGAIEEQESQL